MTMNKTDRQSTDFKEKLKTYRINEAEYDLICGLLKRDPVGIEWALF